MRTIKSKFRGLLALFGAACLALGGGLMALESKEARAAEDSAISQHCPEGATNLALGKTVTASSSYEQGNEGWSTAFLVDGTLGAPGATNGWSTEPHETTDPRTVAWATVDLGAVCSVSRIVLFPRSDLSGNYGESFPVDFQLQLSEDNKEWSDVYRITGFAKPTEPLVVDVDDAAPAQFVRLYVTGRTGVDNMTGGTGGNDGKLVQLSEMAVFGSILRAVANLNKTEIELGLGSSEQPVLVVSGMETPELTWTSDDPKVASVSAEGVIKAEGVGTTTVRVNGEGIEEKTISVIVVEKKQTFGDNILLSVFWLPTYEYLTGGVGDERWDEQFRLLADADIDWLAHVTDNENPSSNLTTKETNLKLASYAYKYGMRLTVADNRFGRHLLTMTDEEIASLIGEYRNVPGVGGYYIWDEPSPAENIFNYAAVYEAIKRADPTAYAHLNFLPMYAYTGGNWQTAEMPYRSHVSDWLQANEDAGYPQDYVMYDFYPYIGFDDGMERDVFFSNLDVMRRIGLEYNVKTATYLQSNGGPNKRSPSPSEIRYEAMIALAYGYKQLSYFTWFLPTNRSESFHDAIVSDQGVPNPKTYAAVSELNREIHALGNTLINLDALQIYHNQEAWGGQEVLPDDWIVQSTDDTLFAVSLMKDKNTGRNYLMFVNNNFTDPVEFDVYFHKDIRSLQVVSHTDGSLGAVKLGADGKLKIALDAGDGVLYALPEGVDFTEETDVDTSAIEELLALIEGTDLAGKDTAALDAAVAELRAALENEHVTQQYLDALAAQVRSIYNGLTATQPDPGPGDSGDKDDDKDSDKDDDKTGGCGTIALGGGGGGGIALGLLLCGALAAILLRRKKHAEK